MAIKPIDKANDEDLKQTPAEEREQLKKELTENEEQIIKRDKRKKIDR